MMKDVICRAILPIGRKFRPRRWREGKFASCCSRRWTCSRIKYREVFVLRDVQHLSRSRKSQKTLGISTASVKTRLLRARLMLRDLLAPKLAEWMVQPFSVSEGK